MFLLVFTISISDLYILHFFAIKGTALTRPKVIASRNPLGIYNFRKVYGRLGCITSEKYSHRYLQRFDCQSKLPADRADGCVMCMKCHYFREEKLTLTVGDGNP